MFGEGIWGLFVCGKKRDFVFGEGYTMLYVIDAHDISVILQCMKLAAHKFYGCKYQILKFKGLLCKYQILKFCLCASIKLKKKCVQVSHFEILYVHLSDS